MSRKTQPTIHNKQLCFVMPDWFDDPEDWKGLIQTLERDLRVVRPDFYELNHSNIDQYLNEMHEMCRRYDEPALVISSGMGAMIAGAYQSKYPNSKLTCVYVDPILPFGIDAIQDKKQRRLLSYASVPIVSFFLKLPYMWGHWWTSMVGPKEKQARSKKWLGLFSRFIKFMKATDWKYWSAASFRPEPQSLLIYRKNSELYSVDEYERLITRRYGIQKMKVNVEEPLRSRPVLQKIKDFSRKHAA